MSIIVVAAPVPTLRAQGAACRRADEIVAGVRQEYSEGRLDGRQAIERLRPAMDLCPSSGEVFRLAACAAQAMKDPRADQWRTRAVLNRVASTDCELPRSAAGPKQPEPLPSYVRQKWALLVGIGSFKDPGISRLQYPQKDAQDLGAVLRDPTVGRFEPANVRILTNEQATRANILDALQDLILRAQPDDLVLLYVSSHGSPNRDGAGLAGVGYIVTFDTEKQTIWRDAIEYQSFADKVALIKARRKVLFLDTCYSGQVAKPGYKSMSLEGVGVGESTAKLFLSGEGTYVISSSRDDERSWESDALRNGYFTAYLMQALRKPGDPPTIKDVFAFLSTRVPESVAREKQEPQHPAIYPTTGVGDLRIGVRPTGS